MSWEDDHIIEEASRRESAEHKARIRRLHLSPGEEVFWEGLRPALDTAESVQADAEVSEPHRRQAAIWAKKEEPWKEDIEVKHKIKVYLSGGISGVDDYEAIFAAAAKDVREKWGYEVISPAEQDQAVGKDKPWGFNLAKDLALILTDPDLEGIVMLPNWEKSKGACLEKQAAEARGLKVIYYGEAKNRGPITRAVPLVHGDRQRAYGHPFEDFTRTAGIWKALFGWEVRPRDVPLAMIGIKLSRLRQSPHNEDSETDIAGYIETYSMCREKE